MLYARVPAGGAAGLGEPIRAYALLRHAEVLAGAVGSPDVLVERHGQDPCPAADHAAARRSAPAHPPPQARQPLVYAAAHRRARAVDVGRLAASLLEATGDGPSDLMDAYAMPLPMMVIATLLGIPAERYAQFRSWSESVMSYSGIPAEEARGAAVRRWSTSSRRSSRRGGARRQAIYISALVEAEIDGARLDTPEAVGFCVGLLVAGNDTTTNLIGNMAHLLSERPELYRRVPAGPEPGWSPSSRRRCAIRARCSASCASPRGRWT